MTGLVTKFLYRVGLIDHLRDRWMEDVRREKQVALDSLREAKRSFRQETKLHSSKLHGVIKKRSTTDRQLERTIRGDLKSLVRAVDRLQSEQKSLVQLSEEVCNRVDRLEDSLKKSADLRELSEHFSSLVDFDTIETHVSDAVAKATMHEQPFPHIVVNEVLPRPFYELLLETLPPRSFFTIAGKRNNHQNVKVTAMSVEPTVTKDTWRFMENSVTALALTPALVARFRPHVSPHYGRIFGSKFGAQVLGLPQVASAGRIMRRRPGYHLAPHLDPRRVLFTGLLYLARPGDSEEFGTQLYAVDGEFVATSTQTFYPEQHGIMCELAKRVPFRANSLLAFLNSGGAHGATIPVDAKPASLERYAYQFYVSPPIDQLQVVLERLPRSLQNGWEDLLA